MTERLPEWQPTHVVFQPVGRFYPVMLTRYNHGTQWAQTREEYLGHRAASLELVGGEWLYAGQPFAGAVIAIPDQIWAEALAQLATELAECQTQLADCEREGD